MKGNVASGPPRVLIITNLFADPWDPTRGTFNQQQFERLSKRCEVRILVPVSWIEVARRPHTYLRKRREAKARWPIADYFVFWYLPVVARWAHGLSLTASLALQRFSTLLFGRWDCVIASWAYPDAVGIAPFALLRRIPFIVKVHGSDINQFANERLRGWQIRWVLRAADQCVAVSRALAHIVRSFGVEAHRISVLYNGLDRGLFCEHGVTAKKANLGWEEADPVILFVGNLKLSKGCMELVDAFEIVKSRLPACRLLIVGGGGQQGSIEERAARRGISDSVQCMGKLAHSRLPEFFRMASLLCLPSHSEGVPNVILEAMGCGLPVVATDVGGIPEVLPPQCGLIVAPRQSVTLADALIQALSRTWDREAIVAHASTYSWETNVDALERQVRTAISSRRIAAEC